MDRLDALKVFCAVVGAGGFSKAAERLGISTSSVTHQVGALEAHFGVKLLNRTTRSMSLTDEGRQCHEHALRLLDDMSELENSLDQSRRTVGGTLRVDMPGNLARLFVAPALPRLLAAHPGLQLKMTAGDRYIDMVEEGIDVLLRVGELPNSSLIARTVCKTRYITCASPAFIARHGRPDSPDSLAGFPCLNFIYPKARALRPWVFQKDGQPFNCTPPGAVAIDHVESLVEMAKQGAGIVQHLSVSLLEPLTSGELVPLLEDWQAPGPDVSALYQHKHHRAAKIQVFVAFLDEVFRQA
ncbi:MAG: LysR family transcriptional regulator [Pseudomonadota bacterium]